VFFGRQCATWSPGLKLRVRVQRLIAGGRTKTRPETTAIMDEIDTRTASATTASKDVISDVVRRGAAGISMRPSGLTRS